MRSKHRIGLAALALALAVPLAAEAARAPRPRPISESERAAVELALAYQQGGAAAWWDLLAPFAPLREMGRPAALAEIGARAGPPQGAVWTLGVTSPGTPPGLVVFSLEFPSGIDDALQIEVVEGAEGWQIIGLRSLADPVADRRRPALEAGAPARLPGPGAVPALALFAFLVGAPALVWMRRPRRAAALAGGAFLTVALLPFAACSGGGDDPGENTESGPVRLGELEPLRRVLAAGTDPVAIARELGRKPSSPRLVEIRNLWHAQLRMAEGDPAAAERAAGRLVSGADLPLAALVRARLALLRLKTLDAESAYQELLELGPDHDGLRIEAVAAASLFEGTRQSEIDNQLIVEMGSRVAEPWYRAAYDAFQLERFDEAEALLGVGWKLRPVPRDELFGDPALAALAARPKIFPLLALDSPREPEPLVAVSSRALSMPPGFEATLCGRELRLARGESEILVPGGAGLSPAGTRPESAVARRDRHRERALAARATIAAALGAGGDHLGPRLLRLADEAARALAGERRWEELAALTDGLGQRAGEAPQLLVRLRAVALDRLDRRDEALELLIGLAERELGGHRPAPGVLFDLAEALARSGDHLRAIKLVRRADADLPTPRGEVMLRQYEMTRDLEADALSHGSRHFDLRFPRATGEDYAEKLAVVFERERVRLTKWIPRAGDGRVTVELFPFERFMSTYGGAIAGVTLLDGRVRLPFADLRSLNPVLVEVLSHELAHAMLADASRDRAPHWFHEGLAQHVQMGTGPVNPIPDLEAEGRVLAFPVLEPVIASFTDLQLVEIAYAESAWAVHFLEARWGIAALHRMQRAFADDWTTERAIAEVTGMDLVEFDAAFRKWALRDAPRARSLAVTRYDLELDSPLERARPQRRIPLLAAAPRATSSTQPAAGKAEMASWYRTYTARAAVVKNALRAVLGPLRSERGLPEARVCSQLADESARLLADSEALASPDAAAASALRELYGSFAAVGGACRDRQEAQAREAFDRAQELLRRAAGTLAPYGQKP